MRLALLSNVTVEVLAGMLRKEHSLWFPPGFGAWMETALNPPQEFLDFNPEAIYLLLDSHFDAVRGDVVAAQASLESWFPKAAVCVLDVPRFAEDFGAAFYDEKMWKLGKMPWSLKGLKELKKVFSFKKVLALDLDNTLWDGVAGEDGEKAVKLNADLIERIKMLNGRGILLTILSKNNYEDVKWFFDSDDPFVAKGINWEPKGENLTQQAKELNLGTDAFVFVDDNPAERAEMRALHPEVLVSDFPPQLEAYFPRRELTAEDLAKTVQYQTEAKRKKFAAGLSVEEYLQGLEIWTDIHPIVEEEVPRVAQLSQKTNQFNVCTNRYTEDDIRRFAVDDDCLLVTLHAGDRFGDQGLVAFVLVKVDGPVATVLDWVMSCRVMNRRIEFIVQNEVERLLIGRGVTTLHAEWRKTLKNVPVKELFEKFGFNLIYTTEGVKKYERILG